MSQPAITEISSATPINALSAVSLDTETTGLDTKVARLLQVGAIRIVRGELDPQLVYETLVNPGTPIPPESTRIHGLTDNDVIHARDFRNSREDIVNWIGNSIVIGYSIGFDLAIFKRENELADTHWIPPRTIDVRHMVKILAPQLPDYSLDTIASWLGITVKNRHQALGDARVTAEIFLALLPQLMKRGIRTLAELETACRVANNESITEAQAGWYDFLGSSRNDDTGQRVYARIDSYPYRHRVNEVMNAAPLIVSRDSTLRSVLGTLMERKISCAFIKSESPQHEHGIVTERDILRAINSEGMEVLEQPAGMIAMFPLLTVPEDAFIYRAMGRMSRHNFRHLGVTRPNGDLVGALSSRDLLRQRAADALDLGDAIDQANSEKDLGLAWANLALVATALDGEDVDARDIAAVISRELRALTRRCCQIAEQEMLEQGLGAPPVPYTMIVLGSGGRGESLLAMDQDNAIIFEQGEPDGDQDQWFQKMGERVSELLNNSGVPYCKGNIMGSNPEWRMSVANWKTRVGTWISRTSPKDLLKTDIFFDAVSVYGDHSLMDEVVTFALKTGASSRNFLHLLSSNAADVQSPIGMLGRFKLDQGRMDVKMGGILPIFSAARVQAIRHQVAERSTPGRLRAVKDRAPGPEQLVENLIEAHRIILTGILKQQLYDLENGIALSNNVAPDKMTPTARINLRWALEQVPSVTDLLGVPA